MVAASKPAQAARVALIGLAALLTGVALAGCVEGAATDPTAAPGDPSASPTSDVVPVLIPDGTAADNEPYFHLLLEEAVADGASGGKGYVTALVRGGFAKKNLEVTFDTTSIGLEADSIEVAVEIGGGCVVGSVSGAKVTTTVLPVLDAGGCLIGTTRPIDW